MANTGARIPRRLQPPGPPTTRRIPGSRPARSTPSSRRRRSSPGLSCSTHAPAVDVVGVGQRVSRSADHTAPRITSCCSTTVTVSSMTSLVAARGWHGHDQTRPIRCPPPRCGPSCRRHPVRTQRRYQGGVDNQRDRRSCLGWRQQRLGDGVAGRRDECAGRGENLSEGTVREHSGGPGRRGPGAAGGELSGQVIGPTTQIVGEIVQKGGLQLVGERESQHGQQYCGSSTENERQSPTYLHVLFRFAQRFSAFDGTRGWVGCAGDNLHPERYLVARSRMADRFFRAVV